MLGEHKATKGEYFLKTQ